VVRITLAGTQKDGAGQPPPQRPVSNENRIPLCVGHHQLPLRTLAAYFRLLFHNLRIVRYTTAIRTQPLRQRVNPYRLPASYPSECNLPNTPIHRSYVRVDVYRRQIVQSALTPEFAPYWPRIHVVRRQMPGVGRRASHIFDVPHAKAVRRSVAQHGMDLLCHVSRANGRRTLPVQAEIQDRFDASFFNWIHRTQKHRSRSTRTCFSYCRSSWRSSSSATPEMVPVNPPVATKKTGILGLFKASATGTVVSVNVSLPDASLKRPVPPVI
jgi:hypothetical protein